MVQPITAAKPHKLTFEEYRFYEGESGVRYELFRGHLIAMATPSGLHTNICAFLVHHLQRHFVAQNLDWVAKTDAGVRTDGASTRIPDVVICSQLLWDQVCARAGAGILDFEETPQLVVEVTSTNWREDYIRKRAEYALLDIPEYWIVDTDKQRIWILVNPGSENGYDRTEFLPGQYIRSAQFPELALSVQEILSPPLVEESVRQEQTKLQQLQSQIEQECNEKQQAQRQRSQLIGQL